jgi:hypothetical protein
MAKAKKAKARAKITPSKSPVEPLHDREFAIYPHNEARLHPHIGIFRFHVCNHQTGFKSLFLSKYVGIDP